MNNESSSQSGGEEMPTNERDIKLRDEYFSRAADLYVQDHNPDSYEGTNIENAFIAGAKCFAASPFSTHPPVVEDEIKELKKQLEACRYVLDQEMAKREIQTVIPVVEGGLKWVDEFKEWLDEKMLYTQGMAEHDGGAYWKGAYNILSDVKDKVDEWPIIPTQVTEDK